jgi:hypothetical protein
VGQRKTRTSLSTTTVLRTSFHNLQHSLSSARRGYRTGLREAVEGRRRPDRSRHQSCSLEVPAYPSGLVCGGKGITPPLPPWRGWNQGERYATIHPGSKSDESVQYRSRSPSLFLSRSLESVPTAARCSRMQYRPEREESSLRPSSLIERSAGEPGFSPLGRKGGEIHKCLA